MTAIIVQNRRLRFTLAFILLAIVAAIFWTSSRYPSLDDKALMGGAIHLEDPLSFEALFPIEDDFPTWKKIILTTLNWMDTNRKGMIFGVLMGALMLTLMRYFQRVSFKNGFLNTIMGLFIGAPLGVCVNCAAPIAKGLYSGGARAETMLAAMISSPTLNVVVLTMMISLLPLYLVAVKLGLTFIVILIAIPVICRFLPKSQLVVYDNDGEACPLPPSQTIPPAETSAEAVLGLGKDLAANLWYIIKLTVPLMILAGFLGSVAATLIPIELLNNIKFGLFGLLIVALIGVFLPAPIAFDVVICAALLAAGLNIGYVMVLLFTLGIFSVYSYFITAQSISIRAASYVTGVVVALAIIAGFSVSTWHNWQTQKALDMLTGENASPSALTSPAGSLEKNSTVRAGSAAAQTSDSFKISISSKPFLARSPEGETLFIRGEAHKIGIDQGIEFSFKDMWPPFWEGRSIATEDVDKDGDVDVLIASTVNGYYLYLNDGTGQFSRKVNASEPVKDWPVFNAALVDLNNDGWPDMFLSTYKKGNYVLWNDKGQFDKHQPQTVKNRDDANLSLSLSFGDVDRDGDLDVALGNWTAGWYRRIPGDESRNRIVYNENGVITGENYSELPGLPGETLSILLTDINLDGALDLLVGNDFEPPDIFYYGDGKGGFSRLLNKEGLIPHTTNTTMAIKNQDLDNDLIPEIYLAQIAGRSSGISERLNMQPVAKYCAAIERDADKSICQKNMDIKAWYKAGNNFNPSYADKCLELSGDYQAQCKAMLIKDLAIQSKDPSICELIPENQSQARAYCDVHFKPATEHKAEQLADNYTQIFGRNVLLKRSEKEAYIDASVFAGLEVGGWSWDTKIADFNNDGWQDVYIVNGTWVPNEFTPANLYFENNGQGQFTEQAKARGLDDFLITAASTHADLDNDGDLDLITVPVNGPIQSFINSSQSGNSIMFKLKDELGNRAAIGAKVTIFYLANSEGENGQQMREIQLGGGFQSFDAPTVHFGLGDVTSITHVNIDWPDGTKSEFKDTFKAGHIYTISRKQL